MNISSLSQQLNMSVQELRAEIAKLGFKVNPRQRKIDNDAAKQILEKLGTPVVELPPETDVVDDKSVALPPNIIVKDLAAKLKLSVVDVVKDLIKNGVMAAMNEEIDFDTASVVAADFGFEASLETATLGNVVGTGYVAEVLKRELQNPQTADQFVARPPIVAVMGHVDHGKTTLLDTLRKTNVVSQEAGAITQHIGAYQVDHKGKLITFLDTPGHEAFTQMRARGANVTDIIILVVAADDGVKPQTVEVINRARLANVPLIVAINKIDKPDANPDRIKQQLSEQNVLVEEWGGKVIAVPVSAKSGQNLDQLLDYALLLAEVDDFKANPKGEVVGTVIESHVARGKGPVATVIIQNGTLKFGDLIVAGSAYGRIKGLEDSRDEKIKQAGPSAPIVVVGLSETAQAGDIIREVKTLDEAREQALTHEVQKKAKAMLRPGIKASGKTLNLIVKADVHGSLEAIEQALEELKARTEEVQLNIIDKGVGQISETDILRAESAGATIIGFNVNANPAALSLAKAKNITIDLYDIIYELLEDVTKVLVSLLSPEIIQTNIGTAKVVAIFRTEGNIQIFGGRVEEGTITDKDPFRIKRAGEIVGSGEVRELQQNKVKANEVTRGSEFGIKAEVSGNVLEGDVLEFYTEEVRSKKLS